MPAALPAGDKSYTLVRSVTGTGYHIRHSTAVVTATAAWHALLLSGIQHFLCRLIAAVVTTARHPEDIIGTAGTTACNIYNDTTQLCCDIRLDSATFVLDHHPTLGKFIIIFVSNERQP